jgi:hypothetical protein
MGDQMIRTGTIPGTPGGPAYRGKSKKKPAPPKRKPLPDPMQLRGKPR